MVGGAATAAVARAHIAGTMSTRTNSFVFIFFILSFTTEADTICSSAAIFLNPNPFGTGLDRFRNFILRLPESAPFLPINCLIPFTRGVLQSVIAGVTTHAGRGDSGRGKRIVKRGRPKETRASEGNQKSRSRRAFVTASVFEWTCSFS